MGLIAFDADGPLADFVGKLCHELSLRGHAVTPDKVRHWCLRESLGERMSREADAIISQPGFCASLPWVPGARDMLSRLRAAGHDVIAVTTPYHSPTWLEERRAWLLDGGFQGKDIIFASGVRKALVRADCLIEDHPGNAAGWCRLNPRGRAALVSRAWNGPDAKEWEWHPSITRLRDSGLYQWIER